MSIYVNAGGGTYSSEDYSQEALRGRWEVGYADLVFKGIIGVDLLPFVGTIREVFGPPRSTGLHFNFADGKRDAFVQRIDPTLAAPKKLSLAMRQKPPSEGPLIPDSPVGDPSAAWRSAAAKNAIGASFRQADTGTSLHIAFNRVSCDVHIDRHGFVVRDALGRVSWDLNGLLRHVTVDLAGDKASWSLVSFGYLDKQQRPIVQATLSPWLAVDLPSRENDGKLDVKIGVLLSGHFQLP